jgi:histidine triad (HIT) family protein
MRLKFRLSRWILAYDRRSGGRDREEVPMADDTIFDRILRKEIPAEIVYENEHVLAFKDIDPKAPVHVLVIPKLKVRNLGELAERNPDEVFRFIEGVSETAKRLGVVESGYRVVMNNGRNAQQSVEYLHAHILGGRAMTWPPG